MSQQKSNIIRFIFSIIVSFMLIVISFLVFTNKQYFIDQLTVWKFQPNSEVVSLANRGGMSDKGKFLFYASTPSLDYGDDFNMACDRVEKTTSILGCYRDYKISIFNVVDPKLDGIKEVTAAHEMLHAVYARMTDDEKVLIDNLLEIEFQKLASDQQFADLISFYERTEPGQRTNELHSVIGTVLLDLDPKLEAHYNKYFTNRSATVALYIKYNGVFENLSNRAKLLANQLNQLLADISTESEQYNADVKKLNSDIESFNIRANNGDFVSQRQFYDERQALSYRVDQLDTLRSKVSSNVKYYNDKLIEYNSIATESKNLYNSIDSTLVPVPSV